MEIIHWIGRFEITMRRLRIAWNDLLDLAFLPAVTDPTPEQHLTAQQIAAIAAQEGREAQIAFANDIRDNMIAELRQQHDAGFPFRDNLTASWPFCFWRSLSSMNSSAKDSLARCP
eukprot:s119_g43.t1